MIIGYQIKSSQHLCCRHSRYILKRTRQNVGESIFKLVARQRGANELSHADFGAQ